MRSERSCLASPWSLVPSALATLVLAIPCAAAAQPIAVHGRVEDDANRPIAGATARLLPELGPDRAAELHLAGEYPPAPAAEAKSAADGTFRLEAPGAGHWRVVVAAAGRAERELALAPLVEETWLRPVALPPEAPLEVRVVGPGGAPIAGALVSASVDLVRFWSRGSWGAPAALLRTGTDGRAVVPRGAKDRLDVAVTAPGHAVEEGKDVSGSTLTVELRPGPRRAVLVRPPAASLLRTSW